MTEYLKLKAQYSEEYKQLNKRHNLIGVMRLLMGIALIGLVYQSFVTSKVVFIALSIALFLFFIFFMKIHDRRAWNRKLKKQLIAINNDEIIYLERTGMPFENGAEYVDFKHFYSFDLDFFGQNSLFQNLNRTATYIGGKKLAERLLSLLKNEEIKANQVAINELAEKLDWRQQLVALAKITKDNKDSYQKLIDWTAAKQEKIAKPLNFIFYAMPALFLVLVAAHVFTSNALFFQLAVTSFLMNLVLLVTQLKKIKKEIIDSDEIAKIVKQYALIIEKIENEKFESEQLNLLKKGLTFQTLSASKQIKKLSRLLSEIQGVQNLLGALLVNGSVLYHLHTLKRIVEWKQQNSQNIKDWLDIIGEFETLNSLANFSYNNPSYVFPALNENYEISLEDLGHPLLPSENRICNDIAFNDHDFVILTGSNMSGKSTFLRTLGINMVLAGTGAPICASRANIHPLNVIVSMRQTDSLNDSESYFFAEVKRLKQIMDKLQAERCFVLLDEILKGTNSDDKQTGTIQVIKKVIAKQAIGVIATHDLDVCETTKEFPDTLTNKCFEVEIVNNDLFFNYKLIDGVCKNKSATFLMKKMEVI
jgi:DNA mismatch repair ATPase MutS